DEQRERQHGVREHQECAETRGVSSEHSPEPMCGSYWGAMVPATYGASLAQRQVDERRDEHVPRCEPAIGEWAPEQVESDIDRGCARRIYHPKLRAEPAVGD